MVLVVKYVPSTTPEPCMIDEIRTHAYCECSTTETMDRDICKFACDHDANCKGYWVSTYSPRYPKCSYATTSDCHSHCHSSDIVGDRTGSGDLLLDKSFVRGIPGSINKNGCFVKLSPQVEETLLYMKRYYDKSNRWNVNNSDDDVNGSDIDDEYFIDESILDRWI